MNPRELTYKKALNITNEIINKISRLELKMDKLKTRLEKQEEKTLIYKSEWKHPYLNIICNHLSDSIDLARICLTYLPYKSCPDCGTLHIESRCVKCLKGVVHRRAENSSSYVTCGYIKLDSCECGRNFNGTTRYGNLFHGHLLDCLCLDLASNGVASSENENDMLVIENWKNIMNMNERKDRTIVCNRGFGGGIIPIGSTFIMHKSINDVYKLELFLKRDECADPNNYW